MKIVQKCFDLEYKINIPDAVENSQSWRTHARYRELGKMVHAKRALKEAIATSPTTPHRIVFKCIYEPVLPL